MKTFVISIPKSGTYLMRELLDQIGLKSSHLHISKRGTYDYSKVSIEKGRKNPRSCFEGMSLKQSLDNIPENSFAVGHLLYSSEVAKLLDGFNVLFIGRDAKETILSFMLFSLQTGRALRSPADRIWINEKKPQAQFLKYIAINANDKLKNYSEILPWSKQANVESFDFNEIRSNPFEQTQRLAHIHNITLSSDEIEQVVKSSFDKKTLTLSAQVDKTRYWSTEAHQKLDALIKKHKIG